MSREIKQYILGPVNVCCYVVINNDAKECFVIDPGDAPDVFLKSFEVAGIALKAILLTHGHFDHIGGVKALSEKYGVPVYALEEERQLLRDENMNLSCRMRSGISLTDITPLLDGTEMSIAGFKIKVIATPGHTSGGVCYYVEEEAIIFTGDTLFAECIGRTDLPTGNTSTLVRSIREKLLVLPEDVIVYPGHGSATTIEHEKLYNTMV